MLVSGGLRYQQDEQQVHRRAVDGVEIHWRLQAQNGAQRRIAANHAAVRDGDAVAEAGRAELLARDQAFEDRSEEHTSELQSLMRISYAVFCLKKKTENEL